MQKQKTPFLRILVAVGLVVSMFGQAFSVTPVSAAQITTRSLTLQSGTTDAGSKPGGIVKHQFDFTLPSGSNLGSIRFQYCTLAAGACNMPNGLITTAATLDFQDPTVNGFTLDNSVNGSPYLARAAAATITPGSAVRYRLADVTNPTTTNQAFYVRISTFASTDTSGSATDTGTVVASTATQIELSGIMPESLVFCTGGTVGTTGGVPDCSTATGGAVSFNQLFSATDTATATSQMAASTNAGVGYIVTVNGTTLTSGSNTIAPMNPTAASIKGSSQFGMNLKGNTAAAAASFPGTSGEAAPAANGTNYRGQAKPGYDTVDNFRFVSNDTVAASDYNTPGGTDAQIFTASYIVNVPGSQPAGTYTTTLTYICTPTF